jgi:hypothetical protein
MRYPNRSCCAKTNHGDFFAAFVRFFGRVLSEILLIVARLRVAPTVRLRAAAILANGSFPAMVLRRRSSSFDQERFETTFFSVFAFFDMVYIQFKSRNQIDRDAQNNF